jgi:hypothetical protein
MVANGLDQVAKQNMRRKSEGLDPKYPFKGDAEMKAKDMIVPALQGTCIQPT